MNELADYGEPSDITEENHTQTHTHTNTEAAKEDGEETWKGGHSTQTHHSGKCQGF